METYVVKIGGIVAIPTDTVYGLVCDAKNINTINRLYLIKNRHPTKPMSVAVNNVEYINEIAQVNVDSNLLHEILPGPVTVVFERNKNDNYIHPRLNPNTKLIGIRVFNEQTVVHEITKEIPVVVLTSANVSGEQSPLNTKDFAEIHTQLNMICDHGQLWSSRKGSTVVDLSVKGYYRVIREGEGFEKTETILKKYKLQPR